MKGTFLTLALASLVASQTTSSCNPLSQSCPADPALGGHATFDFKGQSDRFTSVGGEPSYGDDGATFTIAQKGNAPTIGTKFYIMFGHVDIKMKASPGTGIVSSAILQSDDLDEIDWEWLGGDASNVQSNYFGKGITGNYDRAAFHPVADAQGQSHTYGIDWTKDRVEWSIDGNVVRTLTYQQADNGNQFPQSPMNIRIGSWAGGASDAPGTVEWAGGPTDFSQGPFKMLVESLDITDYSTGNSYSYSDNSGSWQSIKSDGGKVDGTGSPNEGDNVISSASSAEQTGVPNTQATSSKTKDTTPTIFTTIEPVTTSTTISTPSAVTTTSTPPSTSTVSSIPVTTSTPSSTSTSVSIPPVIPTFTIAPTTSLVAATTEEVTTFTTMTFTSTTPCPPPQPPHPATTSTTIRPVTTVTNPYVADSSTFKTIATFTISAQPTGNDIPSVDSSASVGPNPGPSNGGSASQSAGFPTSNPTFAPPPLQTANVASDLRIPGAAMAIGILAAFI